jgi:hypothetical protein
MSYSVLSIEKSKALSSCNSLDEQKDWLTSNYPTASIYKVMYATYPIETKTMYYSTSLSKQMLSNELKIKESNLIPISNV